MKDFILSIKNNAEQIISSEFSDEKIIATIVNKVIKNVEYTNPHVEQTLCMFEELDAISLKEFRKALNSFLDYVQYSMEN